MGSIDDTLCALAETQHGLVARHQVDALGLSRRTWLRRQATGGWEPLTSRVARRAGSPATVSQRALAGVLDAGPSAYVSHESGAAAWGVPGFLVDPVQVISTRGRAVRSPLVTVHLPRHLPEPFAASLDGVPVVRPALLLLQLAPRVHPDRLARTLDWMWSRRLLSGPSARAELDPVMHRGRAGTAVLRELLDGLPADYVPAASGLESRVARIVADHDLPALRRQVDLGDGERWCGRVDFLAVDLPLVLEVDSDRYHRALSDQRADRDRQVRLERAGFTVVRVDEHQVWHRPGEVVEQIRVAAWALRARRARAAHRRAS